MIAGILAVASAFFVGRAVLTRQAEGTIIVTIAASATVSDDTRAKTTITELSFLDDWETMSLLAKQSLRKVMGVKAPLRRHNFDMARAGGSFGDTNFQKHVKSQAIKLHQSAHDVAESLNSEGAWKHEVTV